MKTGEVLGYNVKSKICFDCKARNNWRKTSKRYNNWYIKQGKKCPINHIKSSGEMKKVVAVISFFMFNRKSF